MRIFDKKNKIRVKNMLIENEYLLDRGLLSESKQTEAQALKILASGQIPEADMILNMLKTVDTSTNQKNLPAMAFMVTKGEKNSGNIGSVFNEYNELESKKRVKPIQLTGQSIKIGDKEFTDFIKFSEYIHGESGKYSTNKQTSGKISTEEQEDDIPLFSKNGIDIFDGNTIGKCVKYTQGGLTGKGYRFCIGQPGNTMYQTYRNTKTSTFFYIVDTNRDGLDPLHIVVMDITKYGPEFTDSTNITGTISEYGKDADGYIRYLKSKGVPMDKFKMRSKTKEEVEEDELLDNPNGDLGWFKKLSFEYKSSYIGRGHKLTNDQFDYLMIGNND
jgi:hypothetical protein